MPGPGGGSRGGGGFGGGGGGFRGGGGFGGGPRRPPMHHHHWGWGWGWRPRYYGWGGGGCLGILMLPIILILVAVMILVTTLGGACNAIAEGGVTEYNEKQFQDYADAQYQKVYGTSTAYEDNILLVFLTTEEASEYYYIAWVGDHIAKDINHLFGSNNTELGYAMRASISESGYWYSLDSNLASVASIMANQIESKGLQSSFTCTEEHVQTESKLINNSNFTLTDSTVNAALADFTARTGIAMTIVVEDSTDVLSTNYTQMISGLVIVAVLVGVAIFLIVKIRRNNKKDGSQNRGNRKNNYANGDFTV